MRCSIRLTPITETQDQIVNREMIFPQNQKLGMHSRGYADSFLTGQETRVLFLEEVPNDYLERRRFIFASENL